MSLVYTTSTTEEDLLGIIALQKNNLAINLQYDEIITQGFVTVVHSLDSLHKMNAIEQHIICKDDQKVVAYLLAMTVQSQYDIPVLLPMFEMFSNILYKGKPVSSYNYIVVGQVCVDKNYRGQGILDKCYEYYKTCLSKKYHFAITEIASRNQRSIKAHQRIGFTQIHKFTAPGNEEWSIVVLEW